MDDDTTFINEDSTDPLKPLEVAVEKIFHAPPTEQGDNQLQSPTAPNQQPDDRDHLEPWRRQDLERELKAAIAGGHIGQAANIKAELLGIGQFEPGTYGLKRTSALMDVGAPPEGGFGPFFQMGRDYMANPDRQRVAERYALERYDDARRVRTLSGADIDAVQSQYTQFVVDNRVGKYEVFEGEVPVGQREAPD